MAITLPRPIADYFEADSFEADGARSAEAFAACFTPAAIVRDDGHTYVGRDAIGRWKTEIASKYSYTAEPVAIAEDGGRTIVTSHCVGDFPGSPLDLRYAFVLDGDSIAELEITA
jgi:hypothetical protein